MSVYRSSAAAVHWCSVVVLVHDCYFQVLPGAGVHIYYSCSLYCAACPPTNCYFCSFKYRSATLPGPFEQSSQPHQQCPNATRQRRYVETLDDSSWKRGSMCKANPGYRVSSSLPVLPKT